MKRGALEILTSHRLDALLDRLAKTLRADPLPPLEEEIVVVQSQGMRRWVTLELARRLDCAASLRMPFPGSFCHSLAANLLGAAGTGRAPDEGEDSFSREGLSWRILGLLESGALADPVFAPLFAYLGPGADQKKRYALAVRAADAFDNYQVYRPELLLSWEAGRKGPPGAPHADWQAALWRLLCANRDDHLARRFEALAGLLRAKAPPDGPLPRRVSVFGITSLPPVFLALLRALARHAPVAVYIVCPDTDPGRGDAPLHPLVSSLWRQGADFLSLLREGPAPAARWSAVEAPLPGRDSALHALQSDLLEGLDRGRREAVPPLPLDPADSSLRIHVCHTPMREMEVLRDRVLDALETLPGLAPHDMLVMVPDIETYAPYIQAVFGVDHEGTPRIPFRIADRHPRSEEPLGAALLTLLGLSRARLTSVEILDLLETPAALAAAGIAPDQLPVLRSWIRQVHIRWGLDGAHRARDFGLPPLDAHSWRAGLARLLMGYATGPAEEPILGVLPFGTATAGHADLLGRTLSWLETLFAVLEDLRAPRPLAAWARDLGRVMDALFHGGDEAEDGLVRIRTLLGELAGRARRAGYDGAVEPSVLREHLDFSLRSLGFGAAFLGGGVTFCALKPMRTIPFRWIALAGMDDASFPRRDRAAGFDLMDRAPRKGDRSLKEDDRQLFLETLLAAGDRLHVTYVGRNPRNNKVRAPSPVLEELLDHLDRSFAAPEGGDARRHFAAEHPLQPFSPRYFEARRDSHPALFSYSRENCAASALTRQTGQPTPPFLAAPLAPEDEEETLGLEDLVRFWVHPPRAFCEQALGLRIEGPGEDLEESEPFALDALEAYGWKTWLVERRLRHGADPEAEEALLAASGGGPPGELGRSWLEKTRAEIRPLLDAVGRPRFRDPAPLELRGRGWILVGAVEGLTDKEQLLFRPASLKGKDRLRAWIRHLALNAGALAGARDLPRRSRVVGSDRTVVFEPVERPLEILDALVRGYREGRRAPLPVFEHASPVFAQREKTLAEGGGPAKDPMDAARDTWRSTPWAAGDDRDRYNGLCFRDRAPLAGDTAEFQRWARTLWGPLLDHERKDP